MKVSSLCGRETIVHLLNKAFPPPNIKSTVPSIYVELIETSNIFEPYKEFVG